MDGFTSSNNELMKGNDYDNTGDIRSYFKDGMFVAFGGVDIMGGGACDDGQGIGSGDYAGVTVQDVINSSLDAYNVAGYHYDNSTAYNRVQSALQGQWRNPDTQGPSWEGTFTIPVCDVSSAINSNYQGKQYILQPHNYDNSRPMWCGPVCDGDLA
ncbi:hypothetical protein OEA41_010515 [Lepraria neglecta]|uniref:Uncharacterized protein n=1 Tax=Lepraria neglecta TaxID=209136 RepID=A0AAD9YZ66_9LECA|nr:hypothetical protein OEA41_010515 [Lepraria neglecta]